MTLRHIVSWKLGGETRDARDTQAAEIRAALEPLVDLVPTVRALAVHRNELFDGENYDLTLVADFDDAAGLAVYATHPDHVAAGAVVKRHAIARVATDFTL
ncbi:Dabb family protein [Leucobacter luti]|uniref:Stress responsive alpha/beta barrel protein n=1 Tax=Leucobacter luti TaxID=340320 RepID=A0A4Q7TZR3_9MICO|nr:Dabb family protein [Leucobacter luti]MBL3699122.1 Dabb family protein [Leucobacter luti]RZT66624.1 stress responsive alpha/beta barrel protein [Leucobacter luti]